MIDDLYSQFHKDPKIGIACLYADYKDQTNQNLVHILGSLLRQFLTTALEPIPNEVIQKLHDIQRRGGKVGTEDILAMLEVRLQQLKRAFICIDAVDELEPRVQRQLLEVLKELSADITRLFLTGRGHIEIEVQKCLLPIGQECKIIISASEQDIQEFLEQQIMNDLNPDAMDEELAKKIITAIIEKSQGM